MFYAHVLIDASLQRISWTFRFFKPDVQIQFSDNAIKCCEGKKGFGYFPKPYVWLDNAVTSVNQ